MKVSLHSFMVGVQVYRCTGRVGLSKVSAENVQSLGESATKARAECVMLQKAHGENSISFLCVRMSFAARAECVMQKAHGENNLFSPRANVLCSES